ncbi:LacI family DNA-binding transcriptional regulator [Oceaniglobus indicus]|uniref:LacI family DNA-binding transcriptional regulator n=1 Tax=Oceaniglobus indicus TaxID=2047749 RepID=UPI0013046C7D|nr:LacI family DNA-binding transcriptional regulator [Oceaniglobus indicus]
MTDTQNGADAARPSRVTVKDIAREAGVSIATVSRAISNDPGIAADTRRRVLQKATDMGYSPNLFARGLITRKSGIVAVFANNIINPFYPEVMVNLTRALQDRQMHTLLFTSDGDEQVERALPTLRQLNPDVAVVLAATMTSGALDNFAESRTPVILFNRYVDGAAASSVCCDNFEAGRMVAHRLAASGHRRLAFIEGLATASTNADRRRGFTRGCAEAGLAPPAVHAGGDFTYETGYTGVQALIARTGAIDAVFCANDIIAIGAMDAARGSLGLSIPDDLSVIGFDDIAMASWPSHDLTTVRQPMNAMIDRVMSEIGRIRDSATAPPEKHFLPGRLMVRGSARLNEERT